MTEAVLILAALAALIYAGRRVYYRFFFKQKEWDE
jgi:hypothetical protein